MNPAPRTVVIDAQPRGPRGLSALVRVRGRTVLDHLVAIASEFAVHEAIAVVSAPDDHAALRAGLEVRDHSRIRFIDHPPSEPSTTLRTDRLYSPARLRKTIRKNQDPESAVLWRLDSEAGIRGADDEYQRRLTYQPLGRFWAIGPARLLARALAPTRLRPNMVTLAAAGTMLGASAVVAFVPRSLWANLLAGALLAAGLVLDTSDGHLARLQGTTSEFGRWLDAWLDEVCDMALHMAIAWSMFAGSGQPGWLVVGMAYGMGKLVFMVGVNEWRGETPVTDGSGTAVAQTTTRDFIRMIGHADIRWHLWILLALIGRLEIGLVLYTAYYPARAILGALRKGAQHA